MKFKATFRLLCLMWMILLSVGVFHVHADSCTSYLSDYLSKVDAHSRALKARDYVRVAVIKGTPYSSVPPELKHLEDEYDSDPSGFYKTVEGMGVSLPGYVSGPLSLMQMAELRGALSDAETAYNTAVTELDTATNALEKCQGMSVMTIWCERGANCQDPPGVQDNPKAHFNFKCPNYIRVGAKLPLLAKACPGTWWSCEGVGQCSERWSHLSDEEVAESRIVDSDTTSDTPTVANHPCGVHPTTTSGDHTLQASCSTDSNCISTNFYFCQHTSHTYGQQACGHTYNPGSSSANSHRSVTHPCGRHSYYACQTPSSSETNRHTHQTLPCGDHRYYPCRVLPKHKRAITCPRDSNGQSCSHGTYYACSPHTHSYPSSNNNNNNGNSGDSGNSDTATCSSGHTYDPDSTSAVNRHRTRTCRRSGCDNTWQRCVSSTPDCSAKSGRRCWAQ